ncbi:MAG: RNA methyltransferase [Ignavibacteriales bacterium]
MEEVHDPHNVSAILRTCDAVGVQNVSLVYNVNKFPRLSKTSSASAKKWVNVKHFESIENCFDFYRANGFNVYATTLNSNSKNIYDVDFTKKVAIVLGNEHTGVTKAAEELSDQTIYIPMKGMIQSLNVSVAAAVILYEALRQRTDKKMYDKSILSNEEYEKLIDEWCEK